MFDFGLLIRQLPAVCLAVSSTAGNAPCASSPRNRPGSGRRPEPRHSGLDRLRTLGGVSGDLGTACRARGKSRAGSRLAGNVAVCPARSLPVISTSSLQPARNVPTSKLRRLAELYAALSVERRTNWQEPRLQPATALKQLASRCSFAAGVAFHVPRWRLNADALRQSPAVNETWFRLGHLVPASNCPPARVHCELAVASGGPRFGRQNPSGAPSRPQAIPTCSTSAGCSTSRLRGSVGYADWKANLALSPSTCPVCRDRKRGAGTFGEIEQVLPDDPFPGSPGERSLRSRERAHQGQLLARASSLPQSDLAEPSGCSAGLDSGRGSPTRSHRFLHAALACGRMKWAGDMNWRPPAAGPTRPMSMRGKWPSRA
jgi:hypothetical protein